MDRQELSAIIQQELNIGLGADSSKLSQERRQALEAFEGLPSSAPPAQEGRSSIVNRAIFETVAWTMPSLMRVFGSSDRIMEFTANNPENEEDACAASEYCNHILFRDNRGWHILYTLFQDALIQKNSFAKIFWDEQQYHKTETHSGLTDQQYQVIIDDPTAEIQEHEEYPNPDPMGELLYYSDDPNPGSQTLHDVKIRITRTQGRVKIVNIPPEEIIVSRRTSSLFLDGENFVCHRVLRRYSDLLEQGFDPEALEEVRGYDSQALNAEHIARFANDEDLPLLEDRQDEAMRSIFIEECYIRADMDSDGYAELLKVTSAGFGQVILDIEEIDNVPIISLCPIPLGHKFFGLSLADIVSDLQNLKTALWRQGLDSIYLATNPRIGVVEPLMSENTIDDLLDSRFGALVRMNDRNAVAPMEIPFVGQAALSALELVDDALEQRSGISKHQQGISSDSLNLNQTAAGINMIQNAANARIELIARIFAETGIREMCKMILGLVIKYQQEERIVKITGKWLKFDPRSWDEQMQVEVSVGLGTGNRDGILSHLLQVLQIQQQIVGAQKGFGGLVQPQNVYNALQKVTTNLGFYRDAFFSDPAQSPPPGGGHPDPEAQAAMQKAQAEIQIEAAKNQAQMQRDQQKHELQMQHDQEKAELQMRIEQRKADHAMQLEQFRAQEKVREAALAAQVPNVKADL